MKLSLSYFCSMKYLLCIFLIYNSVDGFAMQDGQQQQAKPENKIIDGREIFDRSKNPASKQVSSQQQGEKKFIIYKVVQGDGWYAIARKFNVSYAELRLANKGSDDKLIVGQEIRIPKDKLDPNDPYYDKNYMDDGQTGFARGETKYHIVQASQTLYSISKMYGISVDELKEWNDLTSNSIQIGQKLVVSLGNSRSEKAEEKKAPPPPGITKAVQDKEAEPEDEMGNAAPVTVEQSVPDTNYTEPDVEQMVGGSSGIDDRSPAMVTDVNIPDPPVVSGEASEYKAAEPSSTSDNPDENYVYANGRHQVTESGTAIVLDEEEPSSERYFAYHKTAPIGTIIRVLNMSNSRKIFVKVTGRLPDNSDNQGYLIKISKSSAEKLGALERMIHVNLLYGIDDE